MNSEVIQQSSWQQRYLDSSTPWNRGECSPILLEWLDSDQVFGPRVLVPGCGHGHEVVELCRRGFEVTAVDFAPAAIDALEAELERLGLGADTVCEDFFNYRPSIPFDSIYEQASLCALPPQSWQRYSEQLFQWLRPGGALLALFMQTGRSGGPPWHCDLLAMQRLFQPGRWLWPVSDGVMLDHPEGLREQALILHKTSTK